MDNRWGKNDCDDLNMEDASAKEIESSFRHHAIPLDQIETLDDNGNRFSLSELMQINELKNELDE